MASFVINCCYTRVCIPKYINTTCSVYTIMWAKTPWVCLLTVLGSTTSQQIPWSSGSYNVSAPSSSMFLDPFFLSKNLKCVEFLNLGKEWLCTLEVYTILWNINPLLLNIPMTTIACMFCSHRHFLCGILDWHLLTIVFTSLVIRLETRDAHLSVATSWTLTTGRDVNPWLWGND